MMWLFAILIVLLIGGVALVATGTGDTLAPVYDDRPDVLVPADRRLGADDLRAVRFTSALRGYRVSEVDALLDRLARELDEARGASSSGPEPGSAGDHQSADRLQDPED